MIFITGDTHGDWMSRLNTAAFPEQKEMTKDDYVIICGDFGYWHDTKSERYNLKWLENKPFTTLFVDGNHENFDRLNNLPVEHWNGGTIHKINSSVYHLMRGQVFTLESKTFLNADVNGAYNIMRKGKQNFTCERLSKGLLESPLRIRLV